MPVKKMRDFLDEHGVQYVTISHSPAYTAQEIAASAHVYGKDLAKTVIIKIDGKLAMAVLPASCQVDLELLQGSTGARNIEIASENEFKDSFPGCFIGAMPPFGNLYGMIVYVDKALAQDEEIAFNAGSHTELVKLKFRDFEKIVEPKILKFAR